MYFSLRINSEKNKQCLVAFCSATYRAFTQIGHTLKLRTCANLSESKVSTTGAVSAVYSELNNVSNLAISRRADKFKYYSHIEQCRDDDTSKSYLNQPDSVTYFPRHQYLHANYQNKTQKLRHIIFGPI